MRRACPLLGCAWGLNARRERPLARLGLRSAFCATALSARPCGPRRGPDAQAVHHHQAARAVDGGGAPALPRRPQAPRPSLAPHRGCAPRSAPLRLVRQHPRTGRDTLRGARATNGALGRCAPEKHAAQSLRKRPGRSRLILPPRRAAEAVGTKTAVQIRSHAQKFFTKVRAWALGARTSALEAKRGVAARALSVAACAVLRHPSAHARAPAPRQLEREATTSGVSGGATTRSLLSAVRDRAARAPCHLTSFRLLFLN